MFVRSLVLAFGVLGLSGSLSVGVAEPLQLPLDYHEKTKVYEVDSCDKGEATVNFMVGEKYGEVFEITSFENSLVLWLHPSDSPESPLNFFIRKAENKYLPVSIKVAAFWFGMYAPNAGRMLASTFSEPELQHDCRLVAKANPPVVVD